MDQRDVSGSDLSSLSEGHACKILKDAASESNALSSSTIQRLGGFYSPCFTDYGQNILSTTLSQTQVPELQNALLQKVPIRPKVNQTGEMSREPKSVDEPKYNKKPGAANVRGLLYKIQLSMLFLLQGLTKKANGKINGFHLAANMQEAGDFKDVVFKCKNKYLFEKGRSITEKTKVIFLHSMHVDDVKNKNIALDFSATNPKGKDRNLDLNIQKHFCSYRRIKRLFLERKHEHPVFGNSVDNSDIDFILYTNALPAVNETATIIRKMDADKENDILYVDGRPETQSYYRIVFDKNDDEKTEECTKSRAELVEKIVSALENSSDCRKLAKTLTKSVFPEGDGNKAELVNQGILKQYHIPLSETVLAKKSPKAKSGTFKETFLNCDECSSERDRNFRNIFFEEATTITGKSENELKEVLRTRSIKLSDKFGDNTDIDEDSETLSLPNDHVSADEIKEFLCKLKIFIGQPGEEQLAEIIKQKLRTTFKVEPGDIDSIYVDVKTKVEKWWKEQNYYLTERNRFFEDSVRISIFFEVKRPVEMFTGRKSQLDDLHSLMQPRPDGMAVLQIAITGLGGIGKTELVRQYVYKHSQDYDNNVIWINAESYVTLVSSFRRLAQNKLKIDTRNTDGNEKDIKSVVEEVYKYFSKRKCIFIFDNAEMHKSREAEDAGIDKFLPSFSQSAKTYILVTSRSQQWENIKVLTLDVFTKEEATQYIKRSLNIVHGSQLKEVEELSEMLQRFPLALQQAVAYIREENKKLSPTEEQFFINDYLEEYRREGTEEKLLDFKAFDSNDYRRTTYITWKITLRKIKKMNYGDEALGILNIMAYFAPDSIYTKMFLKRVPGKRKLGSALQLLKEYSIIGLDEGEANIHRLVQHVIRTELKRCDKEKNVLRDALSLVENGIKERSEMRSKYVSHAVSAWSHTSKYAELVRSFHGLPSEIMSVLDNSVRYEEAYLFGSKAYVQLENLFGTDNFDTLLVLNAVAVVLDHSGKYDEAVKAYERVLFKFTRTLGSDHYCTLAVKHNMAGSLKNQGKHKEALEACEEVLEKRKQILGDSHPDTLTTMNDIAILLKHQGKYAEALKVYQLVLDKRKQILGCDHPDTLMTKHGIALVYYLDRRYDEACEIYQDVLDKRNQILGPDHPDTLMTKNNLASVFCNQRKYDDALVSFQEVVNKTEKVLGSDHPHTFLAKSGIPHTLYQMGSYDEALMAYQEVLDDEQRVLGPSHPETLKTQHSKATVLMQQGKYEEALLTYSELLERENYAFGCEHPITLATQHNKALVLSNMGKYSESLRVYQEVLGKNERLSGPEHPDTLATRHNIASVLHSQGNYSEALRLYQEVLEKRNKILEVNHPDILMTKKNIAAVLCDWGSYDEALQIYKEMLEKSQHALGNDHPDTLTVERNIAGVIHKLGRYDEALTAYQRVLEKGRQILSRDHPENLVTLNNIAAVLNDKGYYHLALEAYEEVLKKREESLGSNHPDTLFAKNMIASVFYNQGNHSKALKIYRDVLQKRKEVLGSDHPDTLHSQNSLASVLDSQQRYQESSKVYEEVLRKRKQILGSDHPDTLTTMNDMARSLCNEGKYGEALGAYRTVLDKRKHVLGPLHPSTLITQSNIGMVLHKQGSYSEAMKAYEEVLNARKKVLGPEHPETLTTLNSIAALLDDQGHHDLSLTAHREVLHNRRQLLGPNHPDTLTTANNMAGVCFNKKSYEEALKIYRDVLDKTKKFLGPDNTAALLTQNNIAAILHAQGNYEDALKIYQEVLDKRKEVLPPDHPDILVSFSNIASLLEDKECFDLSLEIHQDVLVKRERILGPCHPDTVRTKSDIAAALCKHGNYEEALKLFREVFRKREQMLGPDDVSVLATQNNIGVVLHHLEHYEEALEIYLKVLVKRKEMLGTNHPDTLCTMHNIATALYVFGKYDEALQIDVEVLDRRKQVFGPHHPSTVATINRLISVLCDQEKYCDVLKTCLEMLDKEKVLELYNNDSLPPRNIILHVLACDGKLDLIQHLIENGADVLSRNVHDTLLHQAVNNENSEVIKLILDKIKEKYDDISLYIDAPDEDGDTPLMWAAETGNIASFQALLEYGANVNARNKNDWTALHWAAKGGHKEIIELLLANRVDPNIKDKTDRTALDVAYENLDCDVGDQQSLQTVTALLLSVTE